LYEHDVNTHQFITKTIGKNRLTKWLDSELNSHNAIKHEMHRLFARYLKAKFQL